MKTVGTIALGTLKGVGYGLATIISIVLGLGFLLLNLLFVFWLIALVTS